eukprot:131703_1
MLDDDDAILIELQPVVVNTSLVDDSPTERDPSLESEGIKVSEDRNKDRTSVHSTSFNFINSIIGAGIIGLPFALAECGFILGVILLFLVALICDYVARILVETGVKQNKHNFEVLADHLLGPKGYYAVVVSMFLFAFGAMVAYLVIIGDTVPMVFSHVFSESHPLASRRVCIVLFGILLIFPLCLLKSMANLAWSSSLSVLSVAVIVVAIVSQAPGEARDQGISAETQASLRIYSTERIRWNWGPLLRIRLSAFLVHRIQHPLRTDGGTLGVGHTHIGWRVLGGFVHLGGGSVSKLFRRKSGRHFK